MRGDSVEGAIVKASSTVNTQVTRVIELEPEDWYLASWRNLPPLPRPETAPFDREACIARIAKRDDGLSALCSILARQLL